jgi:hypothetical protein
MRKGFEQRPYQVSIEKPKRLVFRSGSSGVANTLRRPVKQSHRTTRWENPQVPRGAALPATRFVAKRCEDEPQAHRSNTGTGLRPET